MALGTPPTSYPSFAYNSAQLASIVVSNVGQWNALSGAGTWQTFPFPGISGIPADPGLTDTDIRLQQILIENRITNQMLQFGLNVMDDPVTQLRPDILANDSSLTS